MQWNDIGDIGHIIQQHAQAHNYSVVREFCGHSIGQIFHEDPPGVHYGQKGTGMALEEGMTFTIEPMINQGKPQCKILGDQWTAKSPKDRKASAQWEHTMAVTSTGVEVLTARKEEAF